MNAQISEEQRRLNIDRMLAEYDLERRGYTRVCPSFLSPVYVLLEEVPHKVHDISEGGLAYYCATPQNPGWQMKCAIKLPGHDHILPATLLVANSEHENLVRCYIKQIGEQERELIRDYVIKRRQELLEFITGSQDPDSPL